MSQRATLSPSDGDEICFDVTLRRMGSPNDPRFAHQPPATALPYYDIRLVVDGARVAAGPEVRATEGGSERQSGRVFVADDPELRCKRTDFRGDCREAAWESDVRAQGAEIDVERGDGTVCFPHGGAVTAETRSILLQFADSAGANPRFAFRWDFGAGPR